MRYKNLTWARYKPNCGYQDKEFLFQITDIQNATSGTCFRGNSYERTEGESLKVTDQMKFDGSVSGQVN